MAQICSYTLPDRDNHVDDGKSVIAVKISTSRNSNLEGEIGQLASIWKTQPLRPFQSSGSVTVAHGHSKVEIRRRVFWLKGPCPRPPGQDDEQLAQPPRLDQI